MRTSTRQATNRSSVETKRKTTTTTRRSPIFYAVIPSYTKLTLEQRACVDAGGPYPVETREHLVEHEAFADFLVETTVKSVESRTPSQEGAREAHVPASKGRVR